jgi:hypothetical protein
MVLGRSLFSGALLAPILALAAPAAGLAQTNVDGRWQSNWGLMTLHQSGSRVTGSYTRPVGLISGDLSGAQLTGYWRQPTSGQRCRTAMQGTLYWGRVSLTFTGAGHFSGRWSYCDAPAYPGSGDWTGDRIGPAPPSPAPPPVGGGGSPAGPPGGPGGAPMGYTPCYTNSYAIARAGPCTVPVGGALTVEQLRPAPAPFAYVEFHAAVATGVLSNVRRPISGGPTFYTVTVPPQLCTGGRRKWQVWLFTANATSLGYIGDVTPEYC